MASPRVKLALPLYTVLQERQYTLCYEEITVSLMFLLHVSVRLGHHRVCKIQSRKLLKFYIKITEEQG